MSVNSHSHVSSSVSPDSCTSGKALRVLATQDEKMRANSPRDWRRWAHDICWEAVFRGNIPKPLFLSCFVCLVFGRLILSNAELFCLQSTADGFPNATSEWGEADRVNWWEVWWSPRLSRGIVLVLQLCMKRTGLWNVHLLQTRSGCPGVCLWWACCYGN